MLKKLSKYLVVIAAVSLALSACGGGSSSYETADESEEYSMPKEADYGASDYALTDEEYSSDDVYDTNGVSEDQSDEPVTDEQIESSGSNRKLIKNVSMSVQTKEFDKLIKTINDRIDSLGGYAESVDVTGYAYNASKMSTRSAYIVARIPQDKLDSFVTTVADNSNITSKNESASDVTLEYSDVSAHVSSLRVEQERLNELLEEADSLDTIIALEQRLTEVRYELESYESRLKSIDNQVDYSTVNLDIEEVKDYTPVETEEKSFASRLADGFTNGLAGAVGGVMDFTVGFVTVLPGLIAFILILAIFVLAIILIIKGIIKASRKSKTKRKPVNNQVSAHTGDNNAGK